VVRVPVGEWERRADVPFGLWAPELAPTRLLAVADVARLVGVSAATITAYLCRGHMPAPVTRLGTSPVWSRRVITQWLAGRPGQGARPRR
jgi:predicted DNA-binding transcriptional regulator AlpA